MAATARLVRRIKDPTAGGADARRKIVIRDHLRALGATHRGVLVKLLDTNERLMARLLDELIDEGLVARVSRGIYRIEPEGDD